jgi:hypothetical protein
MRPERCRKCGIHEADAARGVDQAQRHYGFDRQIREGLCSRSWPERNPAR